MPVTFQNNFNQQAAEIQRRQQLAQLLRQSMPEDQPFAQTGGKYSQVIRQHPLSAALRGLNQGVSAYMLTSAAKDQANLEGQKQQALSNLFSGDKEPGVSEMAQSGLFGGDVLAQALLRKQQAREVAQLRQSMTQGDGYHPPVASSEGWIQYNPNTRSFEYMKIDGKTPLPGQYDPQNKYEMTKAAERPKFAEVELPTGAKTRMPNEQINPIYGNSQPPVFDFQNPQQAAQDLNSGVPIDPASAAQAKYDAFMRQNGLVTGQSTEQKENIKTDAAIREAEEKKKIELQAESEKLTNKKTRDANDVLGLLSEAEPLIDKATGSGLGTAYDAASAIFGHSPAGATEAQQLRMIGGQLTSKMPRMEGPQSNLDAKLYAEMAGQIGDPMVPPARKKAALQMLRRLSEKYSKQSQESQAPTGGGIKFLGFE